MSQFKEGVSRYELVIRPTRGFVSVDLADLWRYRDLLLLLVYRDFAAKYKQTVLGPAWFILQPLLTSLLFAVVFAGVIKVPTEGVPPILFYFTGLLGWSYFAQTFQNVAGTLVNNVGIFGKVYFPRLVMPLSTAISNLLAFGLQLGTMLCFWLYYKFFTDAGAQFGFSATIVFAPFVVLQIAAFSLGVGIWLSALTAKYRDFVLLSAFVIQLWMYATPVIYPFSQIPERWRWVAVVNPMSMPIETLKYMFLGQGVIYSGYVTVSVGLTLLTLLSGVVVFNKVEKTFIDTV
jgi:lipopolysaccharide transport system permease protein